MKQNIIPDIPHNLDQKKKKNCSKLIWYANKVYIKNMSERNTCICVYQYILEWMNTKEEIKQLTKVFANYLLDHKKGKYCYKVLMSSGF